MSEDVITALLRARALRVTPQRRAILGAFQGTADEHLSAEEVAARASMSIPNIGRGTVYATLAELTEVGLLSSIGSSEPLRYETNLDDHDHFRCRLCLRLFDVDLAGRASDAGSGGFTVEAVAVLAEGVCAECHDYLRGLHDGAADALERERLAAADLETLSCARVHSPLGELALVASSEGIVRIAFSDHADFDGLGARADSRRGPAAARARLAALRKVIDGYFAGGREPFPDLTDWRLLDEEERAALHSVKRIPFGQTCSYERLDSSLDAYARGRLIGSNPLPLLMPCHRVTRGSEPSQVYVGGLERLRFLHALEAA